LAHDLGHAPFGHHGEQILSELCSDLSIRPCFHHEVNSLRVVDRLAQFDRERGVGLALTWEVRDGIVSHKGEDLKQRILQPASKKKKLSKIKRRDQAGNPATLEGCIVRMVDKVAYAGRDLEDAIQAGLIKQKDIPKPVSRQLGTNNGKIVGTLVSDIIRHSPIDQNRVEMSAAGAESLHRLIAFNYKRVYKRPEVQRYQAQAKQALTALFEIFLSTVKESKRFTETKVTKRLPDAEVYERFKSFVKEMRYDDSETDGQIVVDFISGFTDNYVFREISDVFVPKAIV